MGEIAIEAHQLGKRYRLGARAPYRALRDTLTDWLYAPARALSAVTRGGRATEEPRGPDAFWALKDVSFEVRRGEAVGIIGRNGAGKSTLLKILSRVTRPTEGRARIHGRVGSLLEVGTGFHPELSGRENIFLNGTILGMKRGEIARKFDEIVAFAEVEKFIDTPVKHYSSGMYTRLAFAVAAHLEPEVLVVDEVLAVGDAAFQKKCLGKMGEVAKEGRTILFVSHNMGAIHELCDRCILIQQGKIHSDSTPDSVIKDYLSLNITEEPEVNLSSGANDATFHRVGLYADDGEPCKRFDVKRPIAVGLEFRLKRPIQGLEIGLAVFNSMGQRIFYSSSAYGKPPLLVDESGDYRIVAKIPGMLLPPGMYSLNIALHRPNITLYDLREHVIDFEVEETGSGRTEYDPKDLGLVMVDMDWKMASPTKAAMAQRP